MKMATSISTQYRLISVAPDILSSSETVVAVITRKETENDPSSFRYEYAERKDWKSILEQISPAAACVYVALREELSRVAHLDSESASRLFHSLDPVSIGFLRVHDKWSGESQMVKLESWL